MCVCMYVCMYVCLPAAFHLTYLPPIFLSPYITMYLYIHSFAKMVIPLLTCTIARKCFHDATVYATDGKAAPGTDGL